MKKSYDIIVVGAGLSSLMFLSKYVKKFPDNKVLLVEKETRKKAKHLVYGKDLILSI